MTHSDLIRAFTEDVLLCKRRLDSGNFSAFQKLSESLGQESIGAQLKGDIRNHLNNLLPQINTEAIETFLTRDRYKCNMDEISEDTQEEFVGTHKQLISEN